MSCIHYKFKSSLEYDTLTFDGLHISLADLKKAIIEHKKLGKSGDFHLQITDAQTKQAYVVDSELIPRNASVIVTRVPIGGVSIKSKIVEEALKASAARQPVRKSQVVLPFLSFECHILVPKQYAAAVDKVAKTKKNDGQTEEERIYSMMQESTKDYDPINYVKPKFPSGKPYKGYICRRCGKPGHFIQNCTEQPPDGEADAPYQRPPKRNTGIPREFLTFVSDPNLPGVKRVSEGYYAVPTIDKEAYEKGKKEKPPFVSQDETPGPIDDDRIPIPGELVCPLCRDLLRDAVVIPCCGSSFCDECVRDALMASDEQKCPADGCGEVAVAPNSLIPNKFLRTAVTNFLNETGYAQIKKKVQDERENSPSLTISRNNSPQVRSGDLSVPSPKKDHLRPTLPDITIPFDLVGLPPQVIQAKLRERDMESQRVKKMDQDEKIGSKIRRSPASRPERPETPNTPIRDEDLFPDSPKFLGCDDDSDSRDDGTPPPPPPPKTSVNHSTTHIIQTSNAITRPPLLGARPGMALTAGVPPIQSSLTIRIVQPPVCVPNSVHPVRIANSQHQTLPPRFPPVQVAVPAQLVPPGVRPIQQQMLHGRPPQAYQIARYPPHMGQPGIPDLSRPPPPGMLPPRSGGPITHGATMPRGIPAQMQRPQGSLPGVPGQVPRMNGPPHHPVAPGPIHGGLPPQGNNIRPVLSEEEFYRTKMILRKEEKRPGTSKADIYDDFAKAMEKKEKRHNKKKRDAYDDFLQGLEKRDRETQQKKDIAKQVQEEQAKLHGSSNKENEQSDSASVKSRDKSRSPSRTPLSRRSVTPPGRGSRTPRKSSRTPLRNRSFSRSPSLRRRSRSSSMGRRSYSRSPLPRRRSYSRTPPRRRSFSRSISPRRYSRSPPPRRRSRSYSRKRSLSPRNRSFSPRGRNRSFSPRNRKLSPRKRSKSPQNRGLTPRRRSKSPRNRSLSPRRRSKSPRNRNIKRSLTPRKRSLSPRRRSLSPRKRSLSPRRRSLSPRKRSLSPRKRSLSPRKRSLSPRKRSLSPRKRTLSPRRRSLSPRKRSLSPRKRSLSPRKRSLSPRKRSLSPRRRSLSPRRRSLSPRKRSLSPRKRSRTPDKRQFSRSPRRSFSKSPLRKSPGRKLSRTPVRNRSFSKSPIRRSKSPFRKRSRTPSKGKRKSYSRSPKRRRSISRTPPPKKRSRTPKRMRSPKRKRSLSRTPPRKRSPRRSRSPPRKKKSFSRTPPPFRRRSRSFSPQWKDDHRRSRSRSPWRKRRSPPPRFGGRKRSPYRKYRRSPSPYRKRTPSPYSGPPEVWPVAPQTQHAGPYGAYTAHQGQVENYYNNGGRGGYTAPVENRGYSSHDNRYPPHDRNYSGLDNRGYQQNVNRGVYPGQTDGGYPVHPGGPPQVAAPPGAAPGSYGRNPPPPGTEEEYMERFGRNGPTPEEMRRLPTEWIQWYQQLHEYRQRLNVYAASKGLPMLDERGNRQAKPDLVDSLTPDEDSKNRRRGRSRSKSPGKRKGGKEDRVHEPRERKYDNKDREKYESKDREKYEGKDREKYESKDREKYEGKDREKYEGKDREKYDKAREKLHDKDRRETKHDKDKEKKGADVSKEQSKEDKNAEKPVKLKEKHKKKKEKKDKSKKEKKKRKNRESKDEKEVIKDAEKETKDDNDHKGDAIKLDADVPAFQVHIEHGEDINNRVVVQPPEIKKEDNYDKLLTAAKQEVVPKEQEADSTESKIISNDTVTSSVKKEHIEESHNELDSPTKKKQYKNKNIWLNRDRIKSLADYDSTSSVPSPKKKTSDSPVRATVDYKDAMSPVETVELEIHSSSELLSPTKSFNSLVLPVHQQKVLVETESKNDDRLVVKKQRKKSFTEDSRVVEKAIVEEADSTVKKEHIPVVASSIHRRKSDDVLVKLPELSKWERESDSDTDEDRKYVERKKKKEEKKVLPRSVIESAANALASKPRRGAMNPVPASNASSAKTGRRVFIDKEKADSRKGTGSTNLMMTINTVVPTKPLSIKDRLGKKVDSSSSRQRDEPEKTEKKPSVSSIKDRLGSKEGHSSKESRDREKNQVSSSSSGGRKIIKLNRDFSRDGRESRRDSGHERESRDWRSSKSKNTSDASSDRKDRSDSKRDHSRSSSSKSVHPKNETSSGQAVKSKDKPLSKSDTKQKSGKLDRKISVADESVFEPDYEDDDDDLADSNKPVKEAQQESSDSSDDDSHSQSRSPSGVKKRVRSVSTDEDKKKRHKTKVHKKHKKHKKHKDKDR